MQTKYIIILTLLASLLLFHDASAQRDSIKQASNDTLKHDHKFTVNGYVKYLEQISFVNDITNLQTNDLIHNRLNFKYQPDDHFTYRLEVRNRIYYGDFVKNYPGFASLVAAPDCAINL